MTLHRRTVDANDFWGRNQLLTTVAKGQKNGKDQRFGRGFFAR